jgi:hypothetical protein
MFEPGRDHECLDHAADFVSVFGSPPPRHSQVSATRNVKRWSSPSMALRWTAAAMHEAKKGFRRLKAFKQLPALRAALAAHYERETNNHAVAQRRRPLNFIQGSARFVKFNRTRGNSYRPRGSPIAA